MLTNKIGQNKDMAPSKLAEMSTEEIHELISKREKAIDQLLAKRPKIAAQLEKLMRSLREIDKLLAKIGYRVKKSRHPRSKMEDGVYEGKYKGAVYLLTVKDGIGTIDGIPSEFRSLTGAAKAATGRSTISGPEFWRRKEKGTAHE